MPFPNILFFSLRFNFIQEYTQKINLFSHICGCFISYTFIICLVELFRIPSDIVKSFG